VNWHVISKLKRRWNAATIDDTNRFYSYVLAKVVVVVIMLLLLWALKDKDVVVVYMKF
jgi:hypothetical protein